MKFLVKIVCLASFICAFGMVEAQEISGNDAQENLFKLGSIDAVSGIVRKFDNRYEGVHGSPYWFDEWSAGTVILENGQRLENVQLRYNVYEDELIIDKSQAGQYYLPKKSVKSFTIKDESSDRLIHFIKYIHPKNDAVLQYYRQMVQGSINLVEYVKVVFEKANFEGGYSNEKRYDEFKKYPGYYYYSESSPGPQKLKLNQNAISKIFPDKNDLIKKYIIDNALDCSDEKNLVHIFEYYLEQR